MLLKARTLSITLLLLYCSTAAYANKFIVISNADSGPGTLRDAITQAAGNGITITDSIIFNITDLSIAGRTIDLVDELPALTSNMIIDGSTQPGLAFAVTDAKIFIRKMDYAPSFTMLNVANARKVKIYGLYLFWGYWQYIFTGPIPSEQIYGIDLLNAFDIEIGAPGKGNVINSFVYGIHGEDASDSCRNIAIRSNFIGQGAYSADPSQDVGAVIISTVADISLANVRDCSIGGPTPADGNVLAGARAIDMDSKYPTGNGFINIQFNHFARGYDKTTFIPAYDFWNYHIHIGRSRYVLNGSPSSTIDYKIQILDNDIPSYLELDHISVPFTLQGNHFEDDQRNDIQQFKALFADCPGGGLVGSEDLTRVNYFRNRNTANNKSYLSVATANVGPVTNLKNVYECNSIYGSTIWSQTVGQPYTVPWVQIMVTTPVNLTGKATPNCRIDLYYDDECTACEGKIFLATTASDLYGDWQYTGSINGTVVALATDQSGRSGDFSAPRFFTGTQKMIQPSCGRNNGSITGITSDGADNFFWRDLRTGDTVSRTIDLTNAGPGEYLLYGVHGGTCIKTIGQSTTLNDQSPTINATQALVIQPGCGKSNGAIYTIFVGESVNVKYSWIDELRQPVSDQLVFTGFAPGKYKLIVQDTVAGCMDSTAVYDLVNQTGASVDISAARITDATCNASNGGIDNIQVGNITGTPSYTWLDSAGRTVGSSIFLSGVPAGNYRLLYKDGTSCDTIHTAVLKIGNNGAIGFDTSGILIAPSKCSANTGSIENISALNADTYSWINTVTRAPVAATANLDDAGPGSYKLIATNSIGCADSSRAYLVPQTAITRLKINSMTTKQESCERKDASVNISGISPSSAGYSLAWIDSLSQQTVSSGTGFGNLGAGKYYFYATDGNGCTQLVDSVQINDRPAPVIGNTAPSIGPDVCAQHIGTISGMTIQGSAPFSYAWYDNSGQIVGQNKDLTQSGAGNYYLQIGDENNCSTTSPVYAIKDTIVLLDAPIYDPVQIVKDTRANLIVRNPEQGNYALYPSVGASLASQTNTSGLFTTGFISDDTTLYVSFSKGECSSPQTPVILNVLKTLELIVPNAFTPNGDGNNDVFRIKNPGMVKKFHMTVFNRSGQKIFETADPNNGWDGKMNGSIQIAGNYVWSIFYEDVLGHTKNRTGNILLIH